MRYVLLILILTCGAGCNPFSPALDESVPQNQYGDARTVVGFFQAFRLSYQFKDTSAYGKLISPNFTFSYRNFDRGFDLEWGRSEEMRTTGSLFESAQALDLLWGNVLDSTGSDILFDITRSFSLNVTINLGEILHVDGRAIFQLQRKSKDDPWQAIRWRDESNF
jgi:hypothetical protein